jgi:uncharacterized oxidoreductase
MPTLTHTYLHTLSYHVFRALGASHHEAHTVSTHVVKANLVGHDSHGVIQVPVYADRIKKGHIVPGAPFEVLDETPSTARIDGHWGFGYVVTERAMQLAIDKAKKTGVAALTVFYQSHIGRLGDYPAMAAAQGMIGMITADSGRGPKAVAPFGGRERRLGTNPLCIAVPSGLPGTIILDMATSAVAAGKISLAINRNEPIPQGWVIDTRGNPTTNPHDYFDGGAILPVGADQGHKGYGLSFMVEMFSGILTGLGFGLDPQGKHNDGCFIAVFNVANFRPLDDFKREMSDFARFVKSSKPAQGSNGVLYPGEIEYLTEQQRLKEGIFIEDETWRELWQLVQELRLESKIGNPG